MMLNKRKKKPFKFNFHFDKIDKKNKAFKKKQFQKELIKNKALKAKQIEFKKRLALKNNKKYIFLKYSKEYIEKNSIKKNNIYLNKTKKKKNKIYIKNLYKKKAKCIFLIKNTTFYKNYPFLLNLNLIKENF